MNIVDAAISYAECGWPVFPLWWVNEAGVCQCHAGVRCHDAAKHPCVRNGLDWATTDIERIQHAWQRVPLANIGIRTGVAFDVLDVDSETAGMVLAERIAQHDVTFPDVWQFGPMAITARGHHLLYAPTGHGNRTQLGGIDGIDWRGARGYIVAPPSIHRCGHVYQWHDDCPPDAPLPEAPPALRGLLAERHSTPTGSFDPVGPTNNVTNATLMPPTGGWNPDGLIARVATATNGTRNDVLNWASFKLGNDYANGRMTTSELHHVIDALAHVAIANGLNEREVAATITSGLRNGKPS